MHISYLYMINDLQRAGFIKLSLRHIRIAGSMSVKTYTARKYKLQAYKIIAAHHSALRAQSRTIRSQSYTSWRSRSHAEYPPKSETTESLVKIDRERSIHLRREDRSRERLFIVSFCCSSSSVIYTLSETTTHHRRATWLRSYPEIGMKSRYR